MTRLALGAKWGPMAPATRSRPAAGSIAAAGADFSNVVETTDYYLTLEGYAQTAAVRKKVFGGPPYPAATGVQVAGLIRPGALIEIKAVAVLGEVRA